MKKLFITMVWLAAGLTALAQGEWQAIEQEEDELKGTEAGTVYMFTDETCGSFVVWDWDTYQFRLTSDHHQFATEYVSGMSSGVVGISVLVGIYDDNGKLKEKFNMWLDKESDRGNRFVRTRNMGTMSNPVGQKGKVKKIFNALKSGSGYVRIVCRLYDAPDFDLKITPYSGE